MFVSFVYFVDKNVSPAQNCQEIDLYRIGDLYYYPSFKSVFGIN